MKYVLHGMKASSGDDMWLDVEGDVTNDRAKAVTFNDEDEAERFLLDFGSFCSEMFSVREFK